MRQAFIYIGVLLLLAPGIEGQISPGDLSEAHKHLEGISNCTQCHVLGEKVSNDKCLDCHTEIRRLIDEMSGYHASREVRRQDCAECHSDHHGRKFDMVRLDEDNFDHDLAGYALTGAHARIDCRQCHRPDYIGDPDLKKREDTYLGLGTACIDCHEDYHQKTLGNDCKNCHDTEAFRPASLFDHEEADFTLKGQHREVECIECHQMGTRNGREFQRFTEIPFNNCNDCHEDAHRGNLGSDCKQCHSEESFASIGELSRFNHSRTGFPLKGRHRRVDCRSCHELSAPPSTIFQDRAGIGTNDCVSCHEDVHEGKFGQDCADCHNERSFRAEVDPGRFDHALTGFPLDGKHEMVECRQCHVSESLTEPLPHENCASCHEDYHEGDFTENGFTPDCRECHTVMGFSPSLFTIENHALTEFPLEGAHLATPCLACHLPEGEEKWEFEDMGTACVDCHEDVHAGEIASKYYPDRDCTRCHSPVSWTWEHHFDHGLTEFKLEGAHARTDCIECHKRDEDHSYGRFSDLSAECVSCHENVHGDQFSLEGQTDCTRCHGFEAWAIADFDHDRTAFPLEGKHTAVACSGCHKAEDANGRMVVQYKMESFECIDCHR